MFLFLPPILVLSVFNGQSIQALVEFFGTLSKEWALECMKDLLLVNLRGNLQIIVQVWKGVTNVILYIAPSKPSVSLCLCVEKKSPQQL